MKLHKNKPVLFVVTFCLVVLAGPAQAGILEFFFPMLRKQEYDPGQTLQAPFAYDPKKAEEQGKLESLPENAISLAMPHRSAADISAWVTTALAESMTFENPDPQADFVKIKANFDAGGWAQYEEFLKTNAMDKVIFSNKFFMRSFVMEEPLLLNEGNVDGRYRWLYEVPLMVTYMDRAMTGYKNNDPVNQQLSITVQIGRNPQSGNDDNIVIERWSGKAQKISKK